MGEMGFSHPMNEGSVLASTLRITDLDNSNYSFDIPIWTAATAAPPLGPLTLVWNDDSTILQLTSDYQLIHERNYRLQMVDNKAKATDVGGETGLPLILGGGAINLLS